MEYYFETDDKLDRKRYAEFLKSILKNSDKYRREDSDGAYVIAIDSPWGTGKTRFMKMFRNYLENRTSKMGDNSLPGKKASFNAVYYNSWDTDFCNDALLPLIYSIVRSPELEIERFDTESQIVLEKFINVAISVAKAAGYLIIRNCIGETGVKMVKAAENGILKKEEDEFESYEKRVELLDEFKISLKSVIDRTKNKKLIIIVDELDRCRPTFAISTLEIAKHLFAINGLVFIFALDVSQLSNSVKTIYGQEMDAAGYLARFFDYIGKMPDSDLDGYETLFSGFRHRRAQYTKEVYEYKMRRYMTDLYKKFDLSIRDINSIISVYKILYNAFLSKYPDISAHELYLYLICLKLKANKAYERLLRGSYTADEIEKNHKETLTLSTPYLEEDQSRRFLILGNGKKIKDMSYRTYNFELKKFTELQKYDKFIYDNKKNGWILQYLPPTKNGISMNPIDWLESDNLEQVLFYEDLKKWDSIKDMTLGQYYYQQLEMFNFALTADNTDSEE